jgi:hypothetical protein
MKLPERLLTARFNNVLTLGLGLPTMAYALWATGTGAWGDVGGLVGLGILGGFY